MTFYIIRKTKDYVCPIYHLSDDPDALEMKENLRKSMTVLMGFSHRY